MNTHIKYKVNDYHMKVLQLGVGKWGINHYKVWKRFLKAGTIDNLYLYDPLKDLSKYEDDFISVVNDLSIIEYVDVVDIVTPPHIHWGLIKKAITINPDIKIFVEKPVVYTEEEFDDIVSLDNRNIMVGHIFRYHAGVIYVMNMIKDKIIGEVLNIFMNRMDTRKYDGGNNILSELMIHDIDILSYWGLLQHYEELTYSKTLGTGVLHMKGTTEMLVVGSWDYPDKVRNIKIVGTEGTIELDLMDNRHIKYNNQLLPLPRTNSPLEEELRHFIIQSKFNGLYRTNIEEITDVMRLIYQIEENQ